MIQLVSLVFMDVMIYNIAVVIVILIEDSEAAMQKQKDRMKTVMVYNGLSTKLQREITIYFDRVQGFLWQQ